MRQARVGGLLVALGVGAAIAQGSAVASAAPTDNSAPAQTNESRGTRVESARAPAAARVSRASVASVTSVASVGVRRSDRRPAAVVARSAVASQPTDGRRAAAVSVNPVRAFLFNQTPTLSPAKTGQSSTGVVSGQLNASDADSTALSYTVVVAPAHGSVSIDDSGRYAYTPDPSMMMAGYSDSFTVTVSDADNGFHLHGLSGLLNMLSFGLIGKPGHSTTTSVSIVVDPMSPWSNPPSVERLILATATDSSITEAPGAGEAPHVVINPSPSVNPRGQLVVFLPGTQGRPAQYAYLLRAAATWGFHAVGLNYPNQTAMGSLCRTSSDPDCYWTARSEVVFGGLTTVPGQSAVTAADSIVNRLNKLLAYLDTAYPTEGWGQFLLLDDTVDWSKVVLAGHSQGGGHVAVLAKTVILGRAVYFSSPDDWNGLTDQPADWMLSKPNVTPAGRQYGFGSDADSLVPNAHAYANWDNLGLPRPGTGPVLVEGNSAPFSGSHQLHTSLSYNPASTALTPALKNHGITVVDTSTPVDGQGKPLFGTNGVWSYLLRS